MQYGLAAWFSSDSGKTFRPRQGHKPGSTMYKIHQMAYQSLGSGDLREAVKVPEGIDMKEWVATKTIDMFDEVAMMHAMIAEYCTDSCCPTMSAGSKFEYLCARRRRFRSCCCRRAAVAAAAAAASASTAAAAATLVLRLHCHPHARAAQRALHAHTLTLARAASLAQGPTARSTSSPPRSRRPSTWSSSLRGWRTS